jgi:hypothetical protein
MNLALDLALKMLPQSGTAKPEIRWIWDAEKQQLNISVLTADGKQIAAGALKVNTELLAL